MTPRIVCIPDLHFPWHSKRGLTRALDIIAYTQPDIIVQLGDLYDMYAASKFARNQSLMTPEQETREGRECAEEFWRLVKLKVPKAKCFQLLGNHDDRPKKRLAENCPAIAHLLAHDGLFKFDGVETILDSRQELFIGDIVFQHGFRTKLGDHAKFNFYKTVHGHTHRGGVVYLPIRGQLLWELDCGHLADPTAAALSYTPQRISHWTLGIGMIDVLGPRFVSLA